LERAVARQRGRHLGRQRRCKTSLLIDGGELAQLTGWVAKQLALLQPEIGPLGVTLRADRDVLAGRHRQRPGHQPRDSGHEDRAV
jgi:hypothetical protein